MRAPAGPMGDPAFTATLAAPWLTARFRRPQKMLSWAVQRPGLREADTVAWLQVRNADLPRGVDPAAFARARAAEAGLGDAVILMTSASVRHHHMRVVDHDDVNAACLMTLGLSNAERVGARHAATSDETGDAVAVGTINALCHVSAPLSDPALVEALSVATQARTTAILAYGYERFPGGGAVTGTGTDCLVLACPLAAPEAEGAYAGLHTAVGEALGAAVLEVTHAAMGDWLRRNPAAADNKG